MEKKGERLGLFFDPRDFVIKFSFSFPFSTLPGKKTASWQLSGIRI